MTSDIFGELVNEFEGGKGAFQALAKDLFNKMKSILELGHKKVMKSTYLDQSLSLIENHAELQIVDIN